MHRLRIMAFGCLFTAVALPLATLVFLHGGQGLLLLLAGLVIGSLVVHLIESRKLFACPRCGARIPTPALAWFEVAEAIVCPECGWDHDSKGRRTVRVRR